MKDLTPQQKKFIEEYARTLDIAKSAISAGYQDKVAKKIGLALLKKEKYLNALNSAMDEAVDHLEIPKAYILKKFVQLIDWASGEKADNEGVIANKKKNSKKDERIENQAQGEEIEAKNDDKNKRQNAPTRPFSPPNDPQILLRSLEGLMKLLEREKNASENGSDNEFSALLGVNCEKI